MSGPVVLREIDDALEARLRGRVMGEPRCAPGFPRDEDLEGLDARGRGATNFAILDGDVVVGTCGTHERPVEDGEIELGWGLVDAARGRGVGTTAVRELLAELRRRHPRATLVARTEWVREGEQVAPHSAASERILAGAGFSPAPAPRTPGERTWRLEPAQPER